LPREKGKFREVTRSGVNLECWIWKGHVGEIHAFQRSGASEGKRRTSGNNPEGWSSKYIIVEDLRK
jgi:hypothetical protein